MNRDRLVRACGGRVLLQKLDFKRRQLPPLRTTFRLHDAHLQRRAWRLRRTQLEHNNRRIFTDHPVEIVAKKIFYRCDELKARDIFDQAVVILNGHGDELLQFCSAHPDKTAMALSRTIAMIEDGALEIGLDALDILDGGQAARQECVKLIPAFFKKPLSQQRPPTS